MSDDPSQIDPPSTHEDAENGFINENLKYVENLFSQLRSRESKLPPTSKHRLQEFKHTWQSFFASQSECENNVASESDKIAAAAVTDDGVTVKPNHVTGTIPKSNKVSLCKNSANLLPPNYSTSHDTDSSCTSSSDEIILKKSVKMKSRSANFNCKSSMPNHDSNELASMFTRLDMRTVPPFDQFTESSDESLINYLDRFEDFCRTNYRGNPDSWKGLLERHLSGKILEAYRSLHSTKDTYDVIKHKLLEWYSDMSDLRRERNKLNFKNARYQEGEAMNIYAHRLVHLFKLAYPSRDTKLSKALREKYVKSVPKSFKAILKSQIMSDVVKGSTTSWRVIQTCARHFDLERAKETKTVYSDDNDNNDEDCVNFSKSRPKMKDVSTQHVEQNFQVPNDMPVNKVVRRTNKEDFVPQPWFANLKRSGNIQGNEHCNYCGRIGHFERECRQKQNRCFSCGSDRHFLRQCPSYRQPRGNFRRTPRSNSQPAAMRNFNMAQGNRRLSSTAPMENDANNNSRTEKETTNGAHFSSHDQNALNRPAPTQRR